MKKFSLYMAVSFLVCLARGALAVSYGDLYDIEWCPCNPEDQFDARGSVVLGKTVMCPCNSMYDGYNSTLEKDMRKLQHDTKKALEKAQNFKYYVGVDYNKSQLESSKQNIKFDNFMFSGVSGIDVPAENVLGNQDNIGIVIGTRPHSNLGIEAFYNRSYSKNTITQFDNKTINNPNYHMIHTYVSQYQAFGVDVLGYLPVTDYFDFIAFVGLGKYVFDNKASFDIYYLESGMTSAVDSAGYDFNENKLAWRLGGGVQFNIARGLVLRSMYRFIKLQTDTINYLQEFSIGIRFLF